MTKNWPDIERKYFMSTFKRLPIVLVRGEGVRVWDEEGKSYLDMVAGIAVNVLGHGHPAVVNAVADQAKKLIHVSNYYYSIPQLQLAELLVENSCGDRVFFCNSGAEANEGAIKLARKFGKIHRNGAFEVITVSGSFHGRTLATIAATGQAKFQEPFMPMPAGFKNVPFNDIEAIKRETTPLTCAILIECIQGESGVHPADPQYIKDLRRWCDEQGLLLMLDEIQTGMGRTGKFLAYENYGIEPDVFTMAKGLGGGVPIGALVARESAACFTLSDHGSTFGGNPLACAAGVATVEHILNNGIVDNARIMGELLLSGLRSLQAKRSIVREVRGVGLMVALDLQQDKAHQLVDSALSKGLILAATGPSTIRMVPALIIAKTDIEEAISKLDEVLAML
ncbi:MAG: acetylornithine transaminase [Chloroflexi bacterium]|nr:acetylornithine transaminase [Chloroflexota bacterium]